jgi:hypothetical protein
MRSKEEIEQLAESYLQKNKYNFDNWKEIEHVKRTYIDTYTQCQKDMADKKYTKKDMIDFAFDTYCYISGIMKVPFNQVSENGTHAEENFKEYIKNKQD